MRHLFLLALLLLAAPAAAQDAFAGWREGTLWPLAQGAGVSRGSFDRAMAGVAPDPSIPGLSPTASGQAEFGRPSAYFGESSLAASAAGGRDRAARHAALLARLEAETGVPGRVLLAIWARESAFGAAAIPHDAVTVLATRATLGPRRDVDTAELVAALQLVERGADPRALRSSWAGALGQPQFLPSSVLAHARDGDGDGVADIWGSEADTLASIAQYLAAHGWRRGLDWGFEVVVPPSVSCALEGPDRARPWPEWEAMGVRRVSGRPFPAAERAGEGILVMPAGRHGPAFLATPNFYVLKDYNTSDLYALWVGQLADRIAFGSGAFAAPWEEVGAMTRGEVATVQAGLIAQGLDTGGTDGLAGFRTRRAIGEWQAAQGLAPTCFPDPGIVAALGG